MKTTVSLCDYRDEVAIAAIDYFSSDVFADYAANFCPPDEIALSAWAYLASLAERYIIQNGLDVPYDPSQVPAPRTLLEAFFESSGSFRSTVHYLLDRVGPDCLIRPFEDILNILKDGDPLRTVLPETLEMLPEGDYPEWIDEAFEW